MALQRTKLTDIQLVPSSVAARYTNAASTKTYIRSILLHNTHSSAVIVSLFNVPDLSSTLGTASSSNRIFKKSLEADETLEIGFYYPITLTDTNDSIQAQADVNNVVTILINGDKDA